VAVKLETDNVRIAEVMATLSYAADLGLGQPMAHCMRQTVIALRMAELVGASDRELEATYYLGLMMNVYCHADAAEQAKWFGDDISSKADVFEALDMNTARTIAFVLRLVGSHGSGVARVKRLAAFPVMGLREVLSFTTTHSRLAAQFAERISLAEGVCVAIRQGYEQWDGKGYPQHLQGEAISLPARLVQLASPVEVFSRRRGIDSARAIVRSIAGRSSTRRWSICFAIAQPSSWTASIRRPSGTPSSTPSPNCRAVSPAPTWTTSSRRWLTWST